MISVVIPTYKSPTYLDLALRSATECQRQKNQIIVVVDGFAEMYDDVLVKYKDYIDVLINEENKGQTYSHNTGVMLADHENILVINDDNVFPNAWDEDLEFAIRDHENYVLAPNQIEPSPSIFKSFVIQDLGKTPETFEYENFISLAYQFSKDHYWQRLYGKDGQTWPLFLKKKYYMALGGIDPNFPSPAVADWDFFLRCEMIGLKCQRFFGTHFYHFASAATKKTPEMTVLHEAKERQSFEYFNHKWGYWPSMDSITHSHINPTLDVVRGVRFRDEQTA